MLCIWATSDTVYSSGVCLSHLSHVLRGCLRFPWRTSSGPVSFSRCCRSWWCWDTLHLSPSSSGREREREKHIWDIYRIISKKSSSLLFVNTPVSSPCSCGVWSPDHLLDRLHSHCGSCLKEMVETLIRYSVMQLCNTASEVIRLVKWTLVYHHGWIKLTSSLDGDLFLRGMNKLCDSWGHETLQNL